MKPILLINTAIFLFAVENVILWARLRDISPAVTLALFQSIAAALGWIALLFWQQFQPLQWPAAGQHLSILACGILLCAGNLCYIAAYSAGGSVALITTCAITITAYAVLVKWAMGYGWIHPMQFLGYGLVAVGVLLVAKYNA